ncbi:coiled-coil domain-containing protein 158-like isoform X2 [Betta splendens]|uniref:Coiled-coil domain-containing protein 158-like isoform X2 n=1 Tax=Betta splendens TaxID=158456 RepID=A0A6P7NEG5_BETSP|nr:coiled-coil domain-containing protein 158-like isoform X2 [Betta splendens]
MSSGSQSTEDFGFLRKNGAYSRIELPPKPRQPATKTTETRDATPRLRFNSMTLDELSEELDKRTKETQRLQEVVENATKAALQRFGCTHCINNSHGQSCHEPTFNVSSQQAVATPWLCGQNVSQAVDQRLVSSAENDLHNAMDVCPQQLPGLQLKKTHDQSKQGMLSFDKAIVNLQTELHKVEMEKEAQSSFRLKESITHVDQMKKMLCMLEDLQNIKRTADQKLQDTEAEAFALNKKVEKLEEVMKKMYSSVLFDEHKQCVNDDVTSPNITTHSSGALKLSDGDKNEIDKLQEKAVLSLDHLRSEECGGLKEQKERMEDLIACLGQEVALLTHMLTSSKTSSVSLSIKLEQLKKLVERQTSLQHCQVTELESTLSSHKDNICCLEQQLFQAQSQLMDARTKQEQSLQQAEELQSQFEQLQNYGSQQQSELQMEVNFLRGRLEVAREQLCRDGEKEIYLQALFERRVQEQRETQVLLQEKDKVLQLRQQENRELLSSLEEGERECQTLHAEGETLRLKLEDQEKIINILRLQTESSVLMTEQHSHTIESLHQENSLLSNQLNQHKLELEHLRAELDQHKSDLAAAERERQQLQASMAEQRQRVQEETLEKQHLITQLESQHIQFLTLSKEYKELQRLHSCRKEEHEGVVLELQSQLKNTHDELDQVRTTLRTLEEADGHGLQVAMDMQKEITARREQVDKLQGNVLHLEEALDKMYQKKRYQNLKTQRQLQELSFIREEKRQLANELEALRPKDQLLRDRIGELEAVLHKMSESFTNCQDFIQLQEQKFFCLKLQHILDLKELNGKQLSSALNEPPTVQNSMTPCAVTAPPSFQHLSNTQTKSKTQQEDCTQEHRSVAEGVISENLRPHSDNSTADSSFYRRRSAPERVHSTAFTDEIKQAKSDTRLRRKTYGSEPRLLRTAELNGRINNNSFIETPAARFTYAPQPLSLGRKSPVHALLTSDPSS